MNLSCYRGETPSWQIACTRNNTPVNLTGATVVFGAKANYADTAYLIEHSSADGDGHMAITNAAGGICVLTLTTTDTTVPNDPPMLVCDVRVTEASGTVTVVATGQLVIQQNVVTS